MRVPVSISLTILLAASVAQGRAAGANPTNLVTLAENHATEWRIAMDGTSSPAVKWAGTELQKYLQHMAGCPFPIAKNSQSKPTVVVGLRRDLSRQDRELLPPAAAPCARSNCYPGG